MGQLLAPQWRRRSCTCRSGRTRPSRARPSEQRHFCANEARLGHTLAPTCPRSHSYDNGSTAEVCQSSRMSGSRQSRAPGSISACAALKTSWMGLAPQSSLTSRSTTYRMACKSFSDCRALFGWQPACEDDAYPRECWSCSSLFNSGCSLRTINK